VLPHYKIGFFYEWGGHMFWARNDNTLEKFGSPIDPLRLPIPSEYAQKFKELNPLTKKDYKVSMHAAKEILEISNINTAGFDALREEKKKESKPTKVNSENIRETKKK